LIHALFERRQFALDRAQAVSQVEACQHRDALSIHYAGVGPLTIEVLDVRGARVEKIVDRASATGTVSWRPTRQMAPGIYFIRLTGPKASIVRRVIRLE